jgi:hypothetical protein
MAGWARWRAGDAGSIPSRSKKFLRGDPGSIPAAGKKNESFAKTRVLGCSNGWHLAGKIAFCMLETVLDLMWTGGGFPVHTVGWDVPEPCSFHQESHKTCFWRVGFFEILLKTERGRHAARC